MALKGKQRKARARWRERVRLEDGLKLDLNGLICRAWCDRDGQPLNLATNFDSGRIRQSSLHNLRHLLNRVVIPPNGAPTAL